MTISVRSTGAQATVPTAPSKTIAQLVTVAINFKVTSASMIVLALATGDIKMEFARNSATRSVGPAPTLGMSASSAQTCTREREETV